MKSKSETDTQAADARAEAKLEANKICDEAYNRANQAYKEAKGRRIWPIKRPRRGP